VIDTPGMRELQIWEDPSQIDASFHDIEALSGLCRFNDCSHENEPGCHVQRAVDEGSLEIGRLSSYKKLKSETDYLRSLTSKKTFQDRKRSQKKFSRYVRMVKKTGKRKY
jgi:ribosome biogenesis GTPase